MILSFVLGLPLVTALPAQLGHTLVEKRQTPDNSCASGVHVVAAPGWGAGNPNYGNIGSLVNSIVAAIPNSNSYVVGPYATHTDFVGDTAAVETQLRQYISDYGAACPSTYMVLVGESAGGVVIMNTLCGGSPSPPWPATAPITAPNLLASVVYGEETYAAGAAYNTGTCANNAPNGVRTNQAACAGFWSRMQNYCDSADPACCSGGTDPNAHGAYESEYDSSATQFVVNTYNSVVVPPAGVEAKKDHN